MLYAPTWRGHVEETNLYSLPQGEQIVSALLQRGARVGEAPVVVDAVCDRLVARGVLFLGDGDTVDIGIGGYRHHLSTSRRR